jgi:flagellar protein FliO/FliZ
MSDSILSFAPALGLLLLLVLLAWGVQYVKKRTTPAGSGQGAELRLVSHLALGPQQRVVVVEVNGPNGPVQLTLGVTPQHVRTLHTQNLTPRAATATATEPPASAYQAVAKALQAGTGPQP